jgi:hypothetical protein
MGPATVSRAASLVTGGGIIQESLGAIIRLQTVGFVGIGKGLKIRFEIQLSRMNCRMLSCALSCGHFGRQPNQHDVGRHDEPA